MGIRDFKRLRFAISGVNSRVDEVSMVVSLEDEVCIFGRQPGRNHTAEDVVATV